MIRILIAIFLLYLLSRLFRLAFRARLRSRTPADSRGATPAEMVACAACGTFIISTEARRQGGKAYCSEQCADRAA